MHACSSFIEWLLKTGFIVLSIQRVRSYRYFCWSCAWYFLYNLRILNFIEENEILVLLDFNTSAEG